jgi:hypothetical protein
MVGVRLRECLVSFIGETANDDLVPEGQEPPKQSDFKGWAELLANMLASGKSSAYLRSYLKKLSAETGASRVSCTPGFVCAVAPGGGCCGEVTWSASFQGVRGLTWGGGP